MNRSTVRVSYLSLCFLCVSMAVTATVTGADWITAPSYYTHSPQTGQRVYQYAPIGPFYVYNQSNFVRSGYRHSRSSLQVGSSADNMHIVEEWGRPVRPYEEWRFPYRPYSVPYDQWGPQNAFGYGYGYGFNPYLNPYGVPPFALPQGNNPLVVPRANPFPGNVNPGNLLPGNIPPFGGGNRPWFDGFYPDAPRNRF